TFMTPNGRVQEIDIDGSANATPRTRFSVPTWRRSTFDDGGSGFAVVGDSERYIVRVSPAGVAVAYVNRWQTLMNNEDSIGRARK
ncbi:MAG: hypothetical protein SGI92_03315, partial [Bryobacteraceae bacterium]|nr:hypothetical protein [Bryobacteraceae bacterium]